MCKNELCILPTVRRYISLSAYALRYVLIFSAIMSLTEIAFLIAGLAIPGLLCGILGKIAIPLSVALLGILLPWGHAVLLAERGWAITRYLLLSLSLLALLYPFLDVWALLNGHPLLHNQALLAPTLYALWFLTAIANFGFMAAAPLTLQLRIVALPLLLMGVHLTDYPDLLMLHAVLKIALAAAVSQPALMLAKTAPLIISMPATGHTPDSAE